MIPRLRLGPTDPKLVQEMASKMGVPAPVAAFFVGRNWTPETLMTQIVNPAPPDVADIFPEASIAPLREAAQKGEAVFVFGDYDADGVTATSIAVEALRALGAEVHWALPSRFADGYGLTMEAVGEAKELGAKVLLTVDCGVTAVKEVTYAKSLGLTVIVTDHHEPEKELPPADALIDPRLRSGIPPLSGAGLALVLAMALRGEDGLQGADLAALGTVADQVPLTGANRWILRQGMTAMQNGGRPGLRALAKGVGLRGDIRVEDILFRLAPRLNSLGRMGSPDDGVHLLLAEDEAEAKRLAERVEEVNRERRELLEALETQARSMIPETPEGAIAIGGDGWHRGLVGILASRLQSRHGVPTFVVAIGEKRAIGSARAPEGADLGEVLGRVSHHLIRFGGHRQAAGFELFREAVPAFLEEVRGAVGPLISPARPVDALIGPEDISGDLISAVERFAPYGTGFEAPVFALLGATVTECRPLGRTGDHSALVLDGRPAVRWGHGADLTPPVRVDALGDLDRDPRGGTVRLVVRDLRPSLWERAGEIWLATPSRDRVPDEEEPSADIRPFSVDEALQKGEVHLVTFDLKKALGLSKLHRGLLPTGPGLSAEAMEEAFGEGWVRGWVGPLPPQGAVRRPVYFLDPPTPEELLLWLRAGARRFHFGEFTPAEPLVTRKDLEALWRKIEGMERVPSAYGELPPAIRVLVHPLVYQAGLQAFGEMGVLSDGLPTGTKGELATSLTFARWGTPRACVKVDLISQPQGLRDLFYRDAPEGTSQYGVR